MTIRFQPFKIVMKSSSEFSDVFTIISSEVVGNEDCFDCNCINGLVLPTVRVGGNRNARIKFKDALIRDRSQSKPVLSCDAFDKQLDGEACYIKHGINLSLLQLSQGLIGSNGKHFTRSYVGDFKQYSRSKIRAASFLSNSHDPVGQIIEVRYFPSGK